MHRGEQLVTRRTGFLRAAVLLLVLVGALRIPAAAGPPQVPAVRPESPAFHEFTLRVQQYVKLQKSVPRLRTTEAAQGNRRAPACPCAENPGDALKRKARRYLHCRGQR